MYFLFLFNFFSFSCFPCFSSCFLFFIFYLFSILFLFLLLSPSSLYFFGVLISFIFLFLEVFPSLEFNFWGLPTCLALNFFEIYFLSIFKVLLIGVLYIPILSPLVCNKNYLHIPSQFYFCIKWCLKIKSINPLCAILLSFSLHFISISLI